MGAVAHRPAQTPSGRPIVPWGASWGPQMRLPWVFGVFRALLASLDRLEDGVASLSAALRELVAVQMEAGPAADRLDALERSHHQFEAMCEGLLMKAEGKFRAANNAEARTRADKRSYEHLLDPLAEIGDEPETPARNPDSGHDAAAGEAEGLSALRLGVAANPKALAQRAKFGLS